MEEAQGRAEEADGLSGWLAYDREAGVLHGELEWLLDLLDWAVVVIDLLAIAILLMGAIRFVLGFLRAEVQRSGTERVRGINRERVELGRYILAGLEVLIVSDIIHTALSLKMIDLVFLGLLVAIRSLISFFLDRELEVVKQELRE
jgi:uncharacterized membrane protein